MAAELLKISRTALYRLVKRRKIAYYRIGSRLQFSREDIAAFQGK